MILRHNTNFYVLLMNPVRITSIQKYILFLHSFLQVFKRLSYVLPRRILFLNALDLNSVQV